MNSNQIKFRDKIDTVNSKAWTNVSEDVFKVLVDLDETIELAKSINYQEGLAFAYLNQGWCNFYSVSMDKAFESFQKSNEIYLNTGDTNGRIKALTGMGTALQRLNLIEQAMTYFNKGLDLAEKTNDIERKQTILNKIGILFKDLNKYEDALEFFQKSYDIAKDCAFKNNQATIIADLGDGHLCVGSPQLALDHYFKGLKIAEENNLKNIHSKCLEKIGTAYFHQKNFKKAREYYFKSIKISEEIKDNNYLIDALTSLGQLFLSTREYDKALEVLQRALKISLESGFKTKLKPIYESLYSTYNDKGDVKAALENHIKLYELEKHHFEVEYQNKLSVLSTQFKLEQALREKEIHHLRHIELKKKTDEIEESYQKISTISAIGQEVTSTLNIDKIIGSLYSNLKSSLNLDIFGIAYYYQKTGEIHFKSYIEKFKRVPATVTTINAKDSLAAICIRENKEILIKNFSQEIPGYLEMLMGDNIPEIPESIIYLPLKSKDKIIGAITIQNFEANFYTQHHVEILRALGSYISSALENSVKHEEVENLNAMLQKEKQELKNANRKITELAAKAHQAGMAEIAESTLHNVGNILNSVVVSNANIAKSLANSSLEKFIKANELLRPNLSDLKNFILNNPKSEHLFKYYLEIEKLLVNEQAKISEQIERQSKHVDLIISAIGAQQKYTGIVVEEECQLKDIIEDALFMIAVELKDLDISIIKKFDNNIRVVIQRSKMIYILMSLFKNAIDSITRSESTDKQIYISVFKQQDNVIIEVSDDGIGMEKTIINQIFKMDFTTKKTKTDYSLHNSAIYMNEMNGEISVKSEGPETGATFLLKFKNVS